jgi:hypothetical protein
MCRAALVLFLCATGCESPIVGQWESDTELGNGEKNKLEVFKDFTAELTVFATPIGQPDAWMEFRFDGQWEDDDTEFDFEWECDGGACTEADQFTMECEAVEEEDGDEKLDCRGAEGSLWRSYPFDFQRSE